MCQLFQFNLVSLRIISLWYRLFLFIFFSFVIQRRNYSAGLWGFLFLFLNSTIYLIISEEISRLHFVFRCCGFLVSPPQLHLKNNKKKKINNKKHGNSRCKWELFFFITLCLTSVINSNPFGLPTPLFLVVSQIIKVVRY